MLSAAPAADGALRTVTVQLNPVELGRVEVRVEARADGGLSIGVTVERPETLALLRADQPALDRALTQAGITPDRSSISFELSGGGQQPTSHGSDAGTRGGGGGEGRDRREAAPGQAAPGSPVAVGSGRSPIRSPDGRLDISI